MLTRRINLLPYESLQSAVHCIGNVNVALGTHRDEVGFAEFTQALAGLPGGRENLTVQIQPEKLPRETIRHVNVLAADLK